MAGNAWDQPQEMKITSMTRVTIPTNLVLDFWLGDDFPSPDSAGERVRRWFVKDVAADARIHKQFGEAIEAAQAGAFDDGVGNIRDWLALLILLDQFPRNVFRDSPRAFAGDTKALALALAGIARGDDQQVHPMARLFCYLPLEHSEEFAMQVRSVELFRDLHGQATTDVVPSAEGWLDFATRHRDVIARFGRFPHRNAVLGRESTPEELAYLAEAGSGF